MSKTNNKAKYVDSSSSDSSNDSDSSLEPVKSNKVYTSSTKLVS